MSTNAAWWNEAEAKTAISIFRRYLELRSVHALRDDLAASGVLSKQRRRADGSPYGGRPLGRGGLYAMLGNRIYRGDITHKGNAYPGEHPAIIEQTLWDAVQALLGRNRDEHASGLHAKEPALLASMLFDADGARLTPTHASKNGTRYGYYVSASLVRGTATDGQGWRIPAADLDKIVLQTVRAMLNDPVLLLEQGGALRKDAGASRPLLEAARKLAGRLGSEQRSSVKALLAALGCSITFHPGQVGVQFSCSRLLQLLGRDPSEADHLAEGDVLRLCVPASLKRAGREIRLVTDNYPEPSTADPSLLRLLARAHDLHDRLAADPTLTVAELAGRQKLSITYVSRLLRLLWLAPDIVTVILDGRQPAGLHATALMHQRMLPSE